MTGPGGFSISPAEATRPEPVTLVMPAHGYTAHALITDPCGSPVPGASVTVAGLTATPHGLPAGTSYVDWSVSSTQQHTSGGATVSLVLASKQTLGKATTCTAHPSPYGGHLEPAPHHTAAAVAAVPVAHTSTLSLITGIGGWCLLAAALGAGCWLWWARRRGRGAHR